MNGTLRVGKIAGIDFSIHYSWLVVFALFSWLLADSILPSRYEGWSGATYWSIGVLGALLLFASVLVHELAHALTARALGLPVEGITLFLFGGVSNLRAEPSGPKGELIVSAAGPLASLGLFAALWLVSQGVNDKTTPFAAVLWYLWFSNLALAIFNSLPAFPMDGGRMLRSAVWTLTGSLRQATRFAARAGLSRAERSQAVWRSKSVPPGRWCSAKMSRCDGSQQEQLVGASVVGSRRQGDRLWCAGRRPACSA